MIPLSEPFFAGLLGMLAGLVSIFPWIKLAGWLAERHVAAFEARLAQQVVPRLN